MHWLTTDGSQEKTKCEGSEGYHLEDEGLTSPGVLALLRSMVHGVDFKGVAILLCCIFPFYTRSLHTETPWIYDRKRAI